MKANAKKLLALILAMVMCLSLAAPAMAASVDAAAEATLSVQDVNNDVVHDVVSFSENGKVAGVIVKTGPKAVASPTSTSTDTETKIYFKDVDTDIDAGKTFTTSAVTITRVEKTSAVVGNGATVTYTVSVKDAWLKEAGKEQKYTVNAERDNAKKLTDGDIAFTKLSDDGTMLFAGNGGQYATGNYMAKGSYYAEKQDVGGFKVYFKLNKLTSDKKSFDKDENFTYAKATVSSCASADDLKKALGMATVCNEDGTAVTGTAPEWAITMADGLDFDSTYNYTVKDSDNVVLGQALKTAGALGAIQGHLATISGDTATYQVSATYQAVKADDATKTESKTETDASKIEADLKAKAKSYGFEVTGVTAGTNGTFNVSVKKTSGFQATYYGKPGDNTAIYGPVDSSGEGQIVLIDASKPGTYTPSSTEGKNDGKTSISEGYKVKSQKFAVKASELKDAKITRKTTATSTATDLATLAGYKDDGWIYFESMAAMMDAFQSEKCTVTSTVNYKQLVVYVKDGTTENKGIILNADGKTVKAEEKWATVTGADTVSGSFTVGNDHHKKVTVKKTKKSTCKTHGYESNEVVCSDCNKVFSTSISKTLPLVEAPLLVGTKEENYIVSDKNWARVATNTDLHTKYASFDDYKNSDDAHYIAEHETTIVKNDKNNTGTVTHKFKDNLGEYHEEYEYTEEIKKANLEHSGRWDSMTTSTQNTQWARDPEHLYGYTVYVADTDVEYTNVALLDGYDYFTFPSSSMTLQPDGTYTDTGYAYVQVKKLDANGKVVIDGWYDYEAFATLSNINVAAKDCLDGSATLTIEIYKLDARTTGWFNTAEQRDEAVKNGKATLVKTHTKDIVVKAVKDHVDANNDGKCDNCDTQIKQVTPDVPTTDKVLTASMVTVKNLTYTGKKQQPEVTVKAADGTELEEGIDYDVATFKKTAVGTYTITVKGKGDWSGKVKATVKIKKAKNPIKVAKTSVSVKAKDVKKKAKTIALKVTKAQGKVTVKSSKKKVVSWKKNKITVAKAAKKGTYKLTFTAKGNKNYKKGTKTVKVVVK